MKTGFALAAVLSCALAGISESPQPQQFLKELDAEQVRTAIDRGVKFLKGNQKSAEGNWEAGELSASHRGGQTALALLALLNAGVPIDDIAVKKGLDSLRALDKPSTYVRSLQTMVFVQAGRAEDIERIRENVKHLIIIAKKENDGKLLGWTYDQNDYNLSYPDASNTQYALLALWTAKQAKVDVDGMWAAESKSPKKLWEQVRDHYARRQTESGGWLYHNERFPTLTMTVAGLSGLLMAQMEMTAGRESLDPVKICGVYEDNSEIKAGLAWISAPAADRFNIKLDYRTFYNIYGLERLGRLSGQRFLGEHDWYREGCSWLVKNQNQENGSWSSVTKWDNYTVVSTSFALLFLSKGRTPVVISKLAHGAVPRQGNDQDWNRRRSDLRHLVEFTSEKVFPKTPLAWQIFDMRREPITSQEQIDKMTSDLLQSPILYITGHESPATRLVDPEKRMIKKYVENGGFILAVACCGSKQFTAGFHDLCQELWPNSELTNLEIDHPVWSMKYPVNPGSFGLQGIQQGCKTVVILSQENLCGFWEINRRTGEGETAFHLGANIVAYATGMEPPKPRLTAMPLLVPLKDNPLAPTRGYFQIGQLISKTGEEAAWKPAPEAMAKLAQHLREAVGLDTIIKTVNVPIDHKDLNKFKFLYMQGRNEFRFAGGQLEKLRFDLKHGGLLLADACCGKETFDKSFRQFVLDLFPGETAKLVPIGADDPLFGETVNGKGLAVTEANIQCRTVRGAAAKAMPPALEGVKIGGRWVVIYSKYDIGCALEKHQAADCLGYSHDSALRLARAAVLYQFRP